MKVKGGDPQDLYKDIFDSFDVDKNGYLSVRELGKCMNAALNKKISKAELKFLITCSDKDENGKMDCYEFSLMASVLHMLSIDDLKELREVFTSFDLDGDGSIDVKELGRCMAKLGQELSVAECQQLIDGADKDSDGEMSFFEFVVMVKQDEDINEEKDLKEAFNMFDINGNGSIDRSELTNVFQLMGKEPTSEELESMFQQADDNGDGNISFEEFKAIMMDI